MTTDFIKSRIKYHHDEIQGKQLLMCEHSGFKVLLIAKDKEKKRMKWHFPFIWII
jgi:DNA-directed RNA polymerase subunit RPC12/RpoP